MLQSFSCILVYTKSCGSPSMKSSIPPIHTNTNFMLCYAQIKNVFLWLKRYNHIFTLLPTEYIKIWFYLCLYLFLIYHRFFFRRLFKFSRQSGHFTTVACDRLSKFNRQSGHFATVVLIDISQVCKKK